MAGRGQASSSVLAPLALNTPPPPGGKSLGSSEYSRRLLLVRTAQSPLDASPFGQLWNNENNERVPTPPGGLARRVKGTSPASIRARALLAKKRKPKATLFRRLQTYSRYSVL